MTQWPDIVGLAILVAELPHVLRRRSDRARDQRADRSSLRVVWIAITCGIAAAYTTRAFGVGPRFETTPIVLAIAFTTCVLGWALRQWAVVTLGRWFTVDVAIREGHALVTTGPFARVRHPSYTGLIAMFVGWSITFGGLVPAFALLVPATGALLYRIHVEEAALAGAFGPSYDAYRARTKRLVPYVF